MTVIRGPDTQQGANVNSEGQLEVHAVVEEEIIDASLVGRSYAWTSGTQDIDATDTMLFVKNTGDRKLHLERIEIIGSNVACTWTIHIGSDTTTPAGGTTITPVNLNRIFSATAADAAARTDETAVADGDIITTLHTAATIQAAPYSLTGIILGKGHYIQINQETESTSGTVTLFAYFSHD